MLRVALLLVAILPYHDHGDSPHYGPPQPTSTEVFEGEEVSCTNGSLAFHLTPECDRFLDTSLAGFSFTRSSTATTVSEYGGVYTLSTVASDTPRYTEHPVFGFGFWSEDTATNEMLRSEEMDDAVWTKDEITISVDAIAAPDGTTTADGLIPTAVEDDHVLRQAVDGIADDTYVWSFFAKAGARNWINIAGVGAVVRTQMVNLVDGSTPATLGSGGVQRADTVSYGNGWWRVRLNPVAKSGAQSFWIVPNEGEAPPIDAIYTGDGVTPDVYVWGFQLELSPIATSYIATTSTAVTRAEDQPLIYTAPGGVGTTGSLIAIGTHYTHSSLNSDTFAELSTNSTSKIQILIENGSTVGRMTAIDTTTQVDVSDTNATDLTDGLKHTISCSYAANDYELYVDDVSGATDGAATVPSFTNLHIGNVVGAGSPFNGVLHEICISSSQDVTNCD